MADAEPTTPPCPLIPASGHCWPDPAAPPQTTAYTAAVSHVNDPGLPTVTATQTVAVDQPGGVDAAPPPARGIQNPPAVEPPKGSGGKDHQKVRRLSERTSRSYARRALRKQFGKHLHRLKVSCRVRHSTAATCKISYRKSNGYRYSGHVWLRYKTVESKLRWQYRMEINKRKRHHKTHRIHRGYRTGGTF